MHVSRRGLPVAVWLRGKDMMVQTTVVRGWPTEERMKAGRRRLFGAVLFGIAVTVLVWHPKVPTEADAVMAASKLAAVGAGVAGAAGPTAGSGPHIAGCPIFPADNVWNTPIDTLKKDKRSDDYIQRMGPALPLKPNFG